ncbi:MULTISPECIES: cupin domain-containing protein [unclassified Sphingomonas]|jgi:quercetin dioxygenase-like cupin family protein|uniref:cupin domain-containing protein n=1 Tax=unclassified Sphingomonas TaxID=196159 RepID=UPI000A71715D|nr:MULTISPECIES: cupin domain-containing protein [unclassified Sphingomonas]
MSTWLFTYGSSTDPDHFAEDFGKPEAFAAASVADHRLAFVNYREAFGGGTSAIVPAPGAEAIGVAYRITPEQHAKLAKADPDYALQPIRARIGGEIVEAEVLLPRTIHGFASPTDAYMARIRYGLTGFYPIAQVDAVIRAALDRRWLFDGLPAQWAAEAEPRMEYGTLFRRLLPWKGGVRTPWGGAVATIAPGTASELFPHDEEELAFVLSGSGRLRLNAHERALGQGDLIYFEPECEHVVTNDQGEEPLVVLFLWWGGADGVAWAGRKI